MIKCKCGSTRMVFQKVKGHKGLYCSECDSWIKWVTDKELLELSRNNQLDNFKMHPRAVQYIEELQGWY